MQTMHYLYQGKLSSLIIELIESLLAEILKWAKENNLKINTKETKLPFTSRNITPELAKEIKWISVIHGRIMLGTGLARPFVH